MSRDLKRRIQRLEQEVGEAADDIVIRVVYVDALQQIEVVAPWHVEITHGISHVVFGEGSV